MTAIGLRRMARADALSPSQLGSKSNIWSKMFGKDEPEAGRFTGEPPRTALTEPPPGYQTPSPDQPYGVGKAGRRSQGDITIWKSTAPWTTANTN